MLCTQKSFVAGLVLAVTALASTTAKADVYYVSPGWQAVPVYQQPVVIRPVARRVVVAQPVYAQPVYAQPVYVPSAPVIAPSYRVRERTRTLPNHYRVTYKVDRR